MSRRHGIHVQGVYSVVVASSNVKRERGAV